MSNMIIPVDINKSYFHFMLIEVVDIQGI